MPDHTFTPGEQAHHFNPNTGSIVRCVEIIAIRDEAAIVRTLVGKNAGKEYPVGLNALAPL